MATSKQINKQESDEVKWREAYFTYVADHGLQRDLETLREWDQTVNERRLEKAFFGSKNELYQRALTEMYRQLLKKWDSGKASLHTSAGVQMETYLSHTRRIGNRRIDYRTAPPRQREVWAADVKKDLRKVLENALYCEVPADEILEIVSKYYPEVCIAMDAYEEQMAGD